MKSVGIICEYNPFHYGHEYHIRKVKELFPNHKIILVLNGDFTQRGDISLINKWKKTEIALNYVDLVVELPFVFGTQSADVFTFGAIQILKALKAKAVVFGSESDDIHKFEEFVDIQNSSEYDLLVKHYLNLGYNYPTSLSKALADISGSEIKSPNDLLALGYVRNLKGSGIKAVSIKRTNDYLSLELDNRIVSGTSIRNALKEGKDVSNYVPLLSHYFLNNSKFIDDYYDLLKYKIISEDISKYQSVDEGIESRIKKSVLVSNSYEELVKNIKTKRYTYNKICRMLLHILAGFTKEEAARCKEIKYIRVLGFNKEGQKYLNFIKKNCTIPIITKFEKNNEMLDIESRVSSIYNLIKCDDNLLEHEHKVIKKDD
ncbi:MAG: nucleotidyltransferase [Bacilli bacterium]|nr:nucleotidyltransferase [Bacilli bacterium]